MLELKKSSLSGLKATGLEVLDFVNGNTGTTHVFKFAFACYHRMNKEMYIIRAAQRHHRPLRRRQSVR